MSPLFGRHGSSSRNELRAVLSFSFGFKLQQTHFDEPNKSFGSDLSNLVSMVSPRIMR